MHVFKTWLQTSRLERAYFVISLKGGGKTSPILLRVFSKEVSVELEVTVYPVDVLIVGIGNKVSSYSRLSKRSTQLLINELIEHLELTCLGIKVKFSFNWTRVGRSIAKEAVQWDEPSPADLTRTKV